MLNLVWLVSDEDTRRKHPDRKYKTAHYTALPPECEILFMRGDHKHEPMASSCSKTLSDAYNNASSLTGASSLTSASPIAADRHTLVCRGLLVIK
jgi:hypothetical protein